MTVKRKTKGTFKYIQGLNFINAYILNSYHTHKRFILVTIQKGF